jgi:GT2 family glycosyltransferase
MNHLSVIIVSYNTLELLRKCLSSIYKNAEGLALQVVIIDNDSRDGSADVVAREFSQAVLVRNTSNAGFAKAVNQGLKLAEGEAILLLNSDVEIFPGTLQRSLNFLQTHSDAGIVGCKLLNPDLSLQPSCESFPSLMDFVSESFFLDKIFPRNKTFGRFHLSYFGYDETAKVGRVMGAFLLIRRRTFADIGLLDESFFFYGEETDWCYRAKQKGWEVYFYPGAEAIHYGGQSADPISPRMFVQLHAARYRFYRKYHSLASGLAARVVLGIGALLRIFLWLFITLYRLILRRSHVKAGAKKVLAFGATLCWYLGLLQRGSPSPGAEALD